MPRAAADLGAVYNIILGLIVMLLAVYVFTIDSAAPILACATSDYSWRALSGYRGQASMGEGYHPADYGRPATVINIIGPVINQSCNGNIESYSLTLNLINFVGTISSSITLSVNTNPLRYIFGEAAAVALYNEYYGYYSLQGVGGGILLSAHHQDIGGFCKCEGYRIVKAYWVGSGTPHVTITGFDDDSSNTVTVSIDEYVVEYAEVRNWCPDPTYLFVIGGGQVVFVKSYYEYDRPR